MTGPCAWPINYERCSVPDGWVTDPDAVEEKPSVQTTYEAMAAEFLWRWTGQTLGLCGVTLRPCRQDCGDAGGSTFFGSGPNGTQTARWQPALIAGKWYNLTCGSCGDLCGCAGSASSLRLPGPVYEVSEVLVDGEVLSPASYWLEGNRLIRTDSGRWPVCQDLTLPPDQPGTWEVSYLRGTPVPVGGQIAAGVLAGELFKAACNDKSCSLPQRIQTITRQGVSVAVLDSFDDVDKGHTGIWVIDSWVSSMMNAPRRARVYSPDLRPKGRLRQTPPAVG